MKNPEITVQKFTSVSGKFIVFVIVFFFLSGVISAVTTYLELKWIWLEAIAKMLILCALLLLGVSWITPGLLIILGVPNFAHAWLRGLSPIWFSNIWFSNKPWEKLSGDEKFPIYSSAIALSAVTLFAIVGFILQFLRG